ncbi:hypothetical protein GCM10027589_29480 [Actinocorallia lasiicapitis]
MIVRIMGEGQVRIDDAALAELNRLDDSLEAAIGEADEAAFRAAFAALLGAVREIGEPLPADSLESSDLVLPPADSAMDEVSAMLGDEGLIPD